MRRRTFLLYYYKQNITASEDAPGILQCRLDILRNAQKVRPENYVALVRSPQRRLDNRTNERILTDERERERERERETGHAQRGADYPGFDRPLFGIWEKKSFGCVFFRRLVYDANWMS